ncbi:MAG: hypothetical protein ABII74_08425 [Elusimicrobiota bacterium]
MKIILSGIIFIVPGLVLGRKVNSYYPWPQGLLTAQSEFSDVGGILLGMRRLSADLAWIQTLQYYGGQESEESEDEHQEHEHNFGGGHYPELLAYCQRVVKLDPYFHYAYLYGAASLAWNLHRYEQATSLLQDGIKYNPNYEKFYIYISAMEFSQKEDYRKAIPKLENIIALPECPLMVKVILAHIYKREKDYFKEYNLWVDIAQEDKRAEYLDQASSRVAELKKIIDIRSDKSVK